MSSPHRSTTPPRGFGKAPPRLPTKRVKTPRRSLRERASTAQWQATQSSFEAVGGSAENKQELGIEEVKAYLRSENIEVDDAWAADCLVCAPAFMQRFLLFFN